MPSKKMTLLWRKQREATKNSLWTIQDIVWGRGKKNYARSQYQNVWTREAKNKRIWKKHRINVWRWQLKKKKKPENTKKMQKSFQQYSEEKKRKQRAEKCYDRCGNQFHQR